MYMNMRYDLDIDKLFWGAIIGQLIKTYNIYIVFPIQMPIYKHLSTILSLYAAQDRCANSSIIIWLIT